MIFSNLTKAIAGKMVKVGVGLGHRKQNAIAFDELEGRGGRVLGPNEVASERKIVAESERERAFKLWNNGVNKGCVGG